MKNQPTETGWIETTIKKFTVSRIKMEFQTIKHWIEFHLKNPKLNSKTRSHCNRCKIKWENMDDKEGWVNLAVTTDGNKVVCCKCATELVVEKF